MKKLKERYNYSIILLKQLVVTDFKLRYQSSLLGYIWTLLRPLATFMILYLVFVKFIGVGAGIPNFPVYLLLGLVMWNYFSEVTNGSVGAIVGKGDLIRKINFPKYVILFAGSVSALINLAINLFVVLLFAIVTGVDFKSSALFVPLIVVEMAVFSVAVGFFLSALFVRFRDVNYIWEVIMQGAFYATPLLYPLNILPASAAKILMLNPMAQIVQDARYAFVTHDTQTISDVYGTPLIRIVPYGIIAAMLLISITYFRKRSRFFAEEV